MILIISDLLNFYPYNLISERILSIDFGKNFVYILHAKTEIANVWQFLCIANRILFILTDSHYMPKEKRNSNLITEYFYWIKI